MKRHTTALQLWRGLGPLGISCFPTPYLESISSAGWLLCNGLLEGWKHHDGMRCSKEVEGLCSCWRRCLQTWTRGASCSLESASSEANSKKKVTRKREKLLMAFISGLEGGNNSQSVKGEEGREHDCGYQRKNGKIGLSRSEKEMDSTTFSCSPELS